MKDVNKISIVLCLFFMLFSWQHTKAQHQISHPSIEYIENQGQWEGPFLYSGTTHRGDIFLKKDGFRIFLADEENHDKIHGIRHGWRKAPQTFKYHTFDISFLNSNPNVKLEGRKPQKHYYNYYLSKDQSRWKSGIHPVMAVDYKNIYDNVDAHVYSDNGNVKYDLIAHPHADLSQIEIEYIGLDKIRLEKGKLILTTSLGDMTESIPYSYQYIGNTKKDVKCKYVLKGNKVSFEVGKDYDSKYDLIIDPALVFCSFTGSTADNWGYTATYDTAGNFYAGGIVGHQTGATFIGSYPTTPGAWDTSWNGGGLSGMGNLFQYDGAISKFTSSGNNLIFSTYLGGADNDQPHSLIVDNAANLVVAGRTYSPDFPTTTGCYDATYNGGGDMFVTKFNLNGTALIGSTFIGGSSDDAVNIDADETIITPFDLKHNYGDDARSEVIVDPNDNIYVTACTFSNDFPTVSPFQASLGGGQDGVIIELNPSCSNLLWSSYMGGSGNDAGYVVSLNKSNKTQLFIGGGTTSSNFPTTAGALHTTYQGGIADGFLMKFNANTKAMLSSTYIGTNQYDQVYGVQTDLSDKVYIMGQTTGAYPVVAAIGTVYSNANSAQFVSKLNNNITAIEYSTVYGSGSLAPGGSGTTDISPNAFLVDICGNVYVSGWGGPIIPGNPGTTIGLPVTAATAIKPTTDGSDFYFIVFTENFQNLLYGSFFGQTGGSGEHVDGGTSRFDEKGVIYQAICAGCGASTIFPTTSGAWATSNGSTNCNLAALKIDFQLIDPDADAEAAGDTIGCAPLNVQFVNNSSSAVSYTWDFGDGSPLSTAFNPSHTYVTPGTYVATLSAFNPNGCTYSFDTSTVTIVVSDDSIHANFSYTKVDSCDPYRVIFNNNSFSNTGSSATYFWDFGDGTSSTDEDPPIHKYNNGTTYTITLVMTDTAACNSPSTHTLVIDFNIKNVKAEFTMPDSICLPALVTFTDQSTEVTAWQWNFGDGKNSNLPSPTSDYTTAGTYTVQLVALNPASCNKSDTARRAITILAAPIAEFTWSPNPPIPNTANIFTNKSTGAVSYLWDFGDGTTSTQKDEVHIYQKDGYYDVCLTARNEFGCIDTTCKRVRGIVVPLVDVPSGFSPNGDGTNDKVYVKGYGISQMTFRIFNRWGEKVFETNNQKVGWDGTYKGKMQEMEVYAYTLDVVFFDGTATKKNGNITLLK